MLAVLAIVIFQSFVSIKQLQCSSLELSKACRREATLVVTVGEDYMPLDRLASRRKHNEVGVRPATAGKTTTGPGVVPASRVPRIRPRGLVWCMDVKALGP
ncbi:unnamed protein product, partial [Ectocarpus sp. 12 AP-2014]